MNEEKFAQATKTFSDVFLDLQESHTVPELLEIIDRLITAETDMIRAHYNLPSFIEVGNDRTATL